MTAASGVQPSKTRLVFVGLSRTLAREVWSVEITVNAIIRGAIQTESELEMFPNPAGIAEQTDPGIAPVVLPYR